jgi:hypothetical protein
LRLASSRSANVAGSYRIRACTAGVPGNSASTRLPPEARTGTFGNARPSSSAVRITGMVPVPETPGPRHPLPRLPQGERIDALDGSVASLIAQA